MGYRGHPPVLGEQFVKQLIEQAKTFDPTILTDTKVDLIERHDDIFVIHTATGEKHYSKTVLLAVGGGIISPQKLTLEGAEKYEMSNLHYTVQSYKRFVDKDIIISGGGNAAIDWAVELRPIAKSVTVVYRKEHLSAHEATVQEALKAGVRIECNTTITKLSANADKTAIQLVTCENTLTKQSYTRQIDEVIVSHGYNREASLAFDEAIAIPKRMIIMLKEKQQVKQPILVFLLRVIFYHLMEKSICYLGHSKMQPMRSILLKRI